MKLLKNDNTYLMNQEQAKEILHGQQATVEFSRFVQFKSIASIFETEGIIHLIFIHQDSKKVYFFAPTSTNDHFQKEFVKNWK